MKITENTEKWEYLYWNSEEQVAGTVIAMAFFFSQTSSSMR